MFAYLNATNEVIATSVTEYTLIEAQAIQPGITTIIANAPEALVVKGDASAEQPYYHQWTSGDGTLLVHYSQVEVLKPLKVQRAAEIDARTEELIAEGFVASNGKRFRIDDGALTRYQVMFEARNAGISFPILVNEHANDNAQSLPSAAAIVSFVEEIYVGHQAIIASGSALKQQIIAASSVAEINAIVDNR